MSVSHYQAKYNESMEEFKSISAQLEEVEQRCPNAIKGIIESNNVSKDDQAKEIAKEYYDVLLYKELSKSLTRAYDRCEFDNKNLVRACEVELEACRSNNN